MKPRVLLTSFAVLDPALVLEDLFRNLSNDFSDETLSTIFEIPVSALSKLRKFEPIEFDYLSKIRKACGLSAANFSYKGIDYPAVLGKLTNKPVVPSRYSGYNYSSKHTTLSILSRFPQSMVLDALNFLQVDETFFSEGLMKEKTSTLMDSDLLFYLSQTFLLKDEGLYDLGLRSAFYHKEKAFGLAFEGLTLVQSYENLIREVKKHLDSSFDYELTSLTPEKAVIRRYLTNKVVDEQQVDLYSNTCLCKFTQGSLSAVAYYSQGKFAHTTEERCVFDGEACCEFHVNLKTLTSLD